MPSTMPIQPGSSTHCREPKRGHSDLKKAIAQTRDFDDQGWFYRQVAGSSLDERQSCFDSALLMFGRVLADAVALRSRST